MENRSARINAEGGEIELENGNELHREEEDIKKEEEELSVEKMFENKEVPPWKKQLTIRAFAVSFLLSVVFCFVVMKLTFTVGIIPSLNPSAGLLGFIFIKTWTKAIKKYSGMLGQPFTRQENTVIQTCVVASAGIAFSGGFGSYLFAMSERVVNQSEQDNYSLNYKNPALVWMIGFLFVTSFLGPFIAVPISKIMITDFRLTYPSGSATAHMINNFHSTKGAKLSKKNFKVLRQFLSFSFLWSFFQWFFTGGDDCGFSNFPIFGLKAYQNRFYLDFSAAYVGVGMLSPCIINASVLVGGILSWGIMWPLINTRKGDWYSVDLKPSSLQGLQGYKVFIGTAMILGDGLYNLLKVLCQTVAGLSVKLQERKTNMHIPETERFPYLSKSLNYDDQCRTHVFLKDQIPTWFAIGGYIAIAAVSTLTLPHVFRQLNWYYMIVEPATLTHIFHQLKWYHIIVIYILAPILAFSNACGSGQTDWSLASHYGKLTIFTIGAWAGASHGGILAGLSACGVVMNIVSTASDLVQDFKTGYLTLASPRSMFVSQIIGTAMGCMISPCVFWIFYKAFQDFGLPTSEYPVPYATTYYEVAKLGVKGFSSLPKECLKLCYSFFATSILINLIRDGLGEKRSWFIPVPTAMAIPFYLGPYFAIDMCIGNLILFIWQKINQTQADASGQVVASGLICGDGIWTLVGSTLALAGVKPPICMKFLSRATNSEVDKFLVS